MPAGEMSSQDNDDQLCLQEALLHNRELYTGDGSVDFHGKPAPKRKSGQWRACRFIIGYEWCERFAFAGVSANLITYLKQKMHYGNASAARLANAWLGTCYLTPLIGALLADSYLGRYRTIAVFSIITIIGMCIMTVCASVPELEPAECVGAICPSPNLAQESVFFVGLYLIAIGVGGKPCVPSFGADQFDQTDRSERISKGSFFLWLFFSLCFGYLVSISLIVWIQDTIGWGIGYGVATIFMGISVAIFFSGSPFYRFQGPGGSPLTRICQVIVASCRNWKVDVPQDATLIYKTPDVGSQKLEHTEGLNFLDKAAVLTDSDMETGDFCNRWRLCSVTQVEELKILIRLFPIWATGIIDCAAQSQSSTIFIEQGLVMQRTIGSFTIPAAAIGIVGISTAVIWVPVYDKLLIPIMRKFTGHEKGFSELQRVGIGFCLTILSMTFAALVEIRRLQLAKELGLVNQNVAVPLSILYQVPQHVMLGIANVFSYVGRLEFFNDQSPDAMRSVCTAFALLIITLGCYSSSLVLSIVTTITTSGNKPGWVPDNLNQGRLDKFFGFWACLCFLNLLVYVLCAKKHKLKKLAYSET